MWVCDVDQIVFDFLSVPIHYSKMKYLWTCLSLVLWFLGAGTAIREATIFPNETLYDEDMSPEYEDFYDLDSSNSTSDLDSRESANDEECKETPTMFSFLRGVHGENRKLPIVKQVPDLNHTMLIVDHLANLTATLLNIQLNKQQLAIMFELFYEIQVSDQCLVSLARLVRAISQRQIWALKCKHFLICLIIFFNRFHLFFLFL